MLPLPDKPTDYIKLADWMELCALIAPDGGVSREDLDSALRTSAVFTPQEEKVEAEIEKLTMDVFRELEYRQSAAVDGYSFDVQPPTLKCKSGWDISPAYVFCLCLSYFGDQCTAKRKTYPRRWFEHLSRDAVMNYLGGEAVRFASPRHVPEIPKEFERAIHEICTLTLREGGGYKKGGLPYPKDNDVDIIAWKHFPDQFAGKILIFGNCATEKDWGGSKKMELCPSAFCEEWMIEIPPSRILRSYFIPHRCDVTVFTSHTRRAGIIFDRCRIAYCCQAAVKTNKRDYQFSDLKEITGWTKKLLERICA